MRASLRREGGRAEGGRVAGAGNEFPSVAFHEGEARRDGGQTRGELPQGDELQHSGRRVLEDELRQGCPLPRYIKGTLGHGLPPAALALRGQWLWMRHLVHAGGGLDLVRQVLVAPARVRRVRGLLLPQDVQGGGLRPVLEPGEAGGPVHGERPPPRLVRGRGLAGEAPRRRGRVHSGAGSELVGHSEEDIHRRAVRPPGGPAGRRAEGSGGEHPPLLPPWGQPHPGLVRRCDPRPRRRPAFPARLDGGGLPRPSVRRPEQRARHRSHRASCEELGVRGALRVAGLLEVLLEGPRRGVWLRAGRGPQVRP